MNGDPEKEQQEEQTTLCCCSPLVHLEQLQDGQHDVVDVAEACGCGRKNDMARYGMVCGEVCRRARPPLQMGMSPLCLGVLNCSIMACPRAQRLAHLGTVHAAAPVRSCPNPAIATTAAVD